MQHDTISRADSLQIGAAVYQPAGAKIGHIARIDPPAANSFTIGAGGMTRNRGDIIVVFDTLDMTTIPSGIADDWLRWAAERRIPSISAEEAATRLAQAEAKQKAWREQNARDQEAARIAREAFKAEAAAKIPAWAKAVIIAELEQDDCDSMTDYFNVKRVRSVILGFSKHTRDLFPELRKMARHFPETADLADAPESAEHREKYSMGAGYYLKRGNRYGSGWAVRKIRFYRDPVDTLPTGAEWCLPPQEPEKAAPDSVTTPAGIRIEEHTHTKKGFQMHICILPERVDREEFNRLRDLAQALGGWYSKPWAGTPGGFAFKDRAAAETFANPGDSPSPDGDGPKGGGKPSPEIGERLRSLADGLQRDIDHKLGDRLTNTPKRQREAAYARQEGHRLQRTQAALRALADAHDAGTIPAELASVRTKAAVYDLVATVIDRSNSGYYDAGIDTGKPAKDSPAARALWAMIDGKAAHDSQAEELRRKVDALRFAKIPGYFPTPRAVIEQMLDHADIPDGPCDVLEPEGGSGAILDALRETAPDARLTTYERHNSLRDVLALKGYALAGSDFMEAETGPRFDRVLMNPPFENGQDIEHVRHAFAMLRPGGRLVSIMSPGPFFRQDRKATEFRAWFDDLAGEKHDLPAGSFKESGTGTAAVLVVLQAEG